LSLSEEQLYRRAVAEANQDPDILDSTMDAEALLAYPKIIITGLTIYVDSTVTNRAMPGQLVTFAWNCRNDGGAGTGWCVLTDVDTGEIIAPRWTFPVGTGQTFIMNNPVYMPSRDLRVRFDIGHVE